MPRRRVAKSKLISTTFTWVAKRVTPTDEDYVAARRIALRGLARGEELDAISQQLEQLHPRNNTFPGEVLLDLAADAIALSGATRDEPIEFENIRNRLLPDCRAHTAAQHRKSIYALRAAAMIAGGVDPDLLGEVGWWQTDDLWWWSFDALVVYIRAAAERTGRDVADICNELARNRGVDIA